MTGHQSSRPSRAAFTAAGETTSPGQAGAPAPKGDRPPARPGPGLVCATEGCGHLDVLHDLSTSNPKRRTRCSVSSGPKATPCGCRRFVAAT